MQSEAQRSSSQYVEEIGRQTLEVLSQRRYRFMFWRDPSADIRASLRALMRVVRDLNPTNFSDEQFDTVDRLLDEIATALEMYLARHVSNQDTVNCQALGEGIRDLRDAKEWIAQGLSPDPARRPTDESLRALGNESALRALAGIVPPKQPVLPI